VYKKKSTDSPSPFDFLCVILCPGTMCATASLRLHLVCDTDLELGHVDTTCRRNISNQGLANGVLNSGVHTEALALISEYIDEKSVLLITSPPRASASHMQARTVRTCCTSSFRAS
jgi:hypothetical protein